MNQREIELADHQPTMPRVAEILSKATGRKISSVLTPVGEARDFSEDYAIMIERIDRADYKCGHPSPRKRLHNQADRAGQWTSCFGVTAGS
jgi:hypothetical protein